MFSGGAPPGVGGGARHQEARNKGNTIVSVGVEAEAPTFGNQRNTKATEPQDHKATRQQATTSQ